MVIVALSLSLATQIGAMFVMIFVGFLLVRKSVLSLRDCNALSRIVLYVSGPCAIINAFQLTISENKVKGFLLAIFVAIGIHILFMAMTALLGRIFHFSPIEKASLIYSNCGNLIIPLVILIMNQKMVFYCSAYMIVQIVLIWTHCKSLISQKQDFDLKAILSNINMIAIGVGLLLFILQIRLPVLITSAFTSMTNLMGPLCMFVAGMLLAGIDLKKVVHNKRAYLVVFLRLIVLPFMVALIFIISGLYKVLPNARSILMISLLAASAPAASTVTQFAQIYDHQPFEASVINVLSLLLCIITMPLLNMFYMSLT